MTPAERTLRARIAAHEKWAKTDPLAGTAAARAAAMARFDREADPDGCLPPAERARRAQHLRSAYYSRLALRSARARRSKSLGADTTSAAEMKTIAAPNSSAHDA